MTPAGRARGLRLGWTPCQRWCLLGRAQSGPKTPEVPARVVGGPCCQTRSRFRPGPRSRPPTSRLPVRRYAYLAPGGGHTGQGLVDVLRVDAGKHAGRQSARSRAGRLGPGSAAADPSGRPWPARYPRRSASRPRRRPDSAPRCAPVNKPRPRPGSAARRRARADPGRRPRRTQTPTPHGRTGTTRKPASARSAGPGLWRRPGPAAAGTRRT